MPRYCYKRTNGTLKFMEMSVAEKAAKEEEARAEGLPDLAILGPRGGVLTRDFPGEHADRAPGHGSIYPFFSRSLGCNRSEVAEFMRRDRKIGFETQYDGRGQLKITDQQFFKRYCEKLDIENRSGGLSSF